PRLHCPLCTFHAQATTEIYTLSLHDALPICSLIGTSTNLVVQGFLIKNHLRPMSFFEIGRVGFPCALIGAFYLLTLGRRSARRRSEEHTSELQSLRHLVCRLLLEQKNAPDTP